MSGSGAGPYTGADGSRGETVVKQRLRSVRRAWMSCSCAGRRTSRRRRGSASGRTPPAARRGRRRRPGRASTTSRTGSASRPTRSTCTPGSRRSTGGPVRGAGVDPTLDENGVLRLGGGWVSLPPVEARLTEALLDRSGRSSAASALARAGWPAARPAATPSTSTCCVSGAGSPRSASPSGRCAPAATCWSGPAWTAPHTEPLNRRWLPRRGRTTTARSGRVSRLGRRLGGAGGRWPRGRGSGRRGWIGRRSSSSS